MLKDYYDNPTQVCLTIVVDGEQIKYAAIAYRDELIDMENGEVENISDFMAGCLETISECRDMYDATGNVKWLELIPERFADVYENNWIDVSDEIIGDY